MPVDEHTGDLYLDPDEATRVLNPNDAGLVQRGICWIGGHHWQGHWYQEDGERIPALTCANCLEMRVYDDERRQQPDTTGNGGDG